MQAKMREAVEKSQPMNADMSESSIDISPIVAPETTEPRGESPDERAPKMVEPRTASPDEGGPHVWRGFVLEGVSWES